MTNKLESLDATQRPMLETAMAHTYEIQDGDREHYVPFMACKRNVAPETLPLKNGNIANFVSAVEKPWGGWRLFYLVGKASPISV